MRTQNLKAIRMCNIKKIRTQKFKKKRIYRMYSFNIFLFKFYLVDTLGIQIRYIQG